ncbi:uncharacterized protein LOC132642105 [Lycium barbarum]|uniref:uncharacterized protein LOC132642105 n=1 Tax=Lycium barbarum TaxID=112863 RepID=UPI00293F14D6|nr:uncharacterized protein LOC132642105 [Lycium barbarum]
MIVNVESQRGIGHSHVTGMTNDASDTNALMTNRIQPTMANRIQTAGPAACWSNRSVYSGYHNSFRSRTNSSDKSHLYCELCKNKGHTKDICFKLHGYPVHFKFKKKGGPVNSYANNAMTTEDQYQSNYSNAPGFTPSSGSNSSVPNTPMSFFTQEQHSHIMQMLKVNDHEPIANSARLNSGARSSRNTPGTSATGRLRVLDVKDKNKVNLPNGKPVDISHIGDDISIGKVLRIGREDDGLYILQADQSELSLTLGVKCLRTDNGTEFLNEQVSSLLKDHGMLHQTSCVYTPQQNGVVERRHRTILDMARALRFQAHMPLKFWGHCVSTSVYLLNRLPSQALYGLSAYEKLFQTAPLIDHLKGYILFDLTFKDIFASRDTVFEEDIFPFKSTQSDISPIFPILTLTSDDEGVSSFSYTPPVLSSPPDSLSHDTDHTVPSLDLVSSPTSPCVVLPPTFPSVLSDDVRKSSRSIKPPAWMTDYAMPSKPRTSAHIFASFVSYDHLSPHHKAALTAFSVIF